jgi:hypothetical protein
MGTPRVDFKPATQASPPRHDYLQAIAQTLRSLLVPALGLSALVLGVATGIVATKLSMTPAMMILAGMAVVLAAFTRPELLVLSCWLSVRVSSTSNSIPDINLGFNFTPIEICLMLLWAWY